MSLQQSEANRDRVSEIMADGAPPPSAGAVKRALDRKEYDRRRQKAATKRREEIAEAAALGVAVILKTAVDTKWTEDEDTALRALYPYYAQMVKKLPHRSYQALRTRVRFLGIAPTRKLWTTQETEILRRLWSSATVIEIAAAIPRWNYSNISRRAQYMGLPPRGRQPLMLSGNDLCDEIRDRCRILGYSMKYLDRIACSGTYFHHLEWKGKSGHRYIPMIRALKALGGTLKVEWPD